MPRILADRYELRELVGAGGVARVHRAVDHHLERDVAIKMLDDDRARAADPSGRDRFLREARSAARLHHPHLVTVYDAGEDHGELFLVMELVDGQSLAALIARRAPLPVAEAVSCAVQILEGLSAVHADGLIHRDVKPANVLVDRSGRVLLTDFGIAKRLDEIEEHLTSSGTVVGTPTYLAPEQAVGGRLSESTDVYLVGLVLYEMLTGIRPTTSARDPRDVRREVPTGIAAAVVRATEPNPGDRFESAQEMIDALRAAPSRVATMAFPAAGAGSLARTTVTSPGGGVGTVAPTTIATVPGPPAPSGPWLSGWWLLAAVATVLALIVGLLLIADAAPGEPDQPAPSTIAATVAATVPAAPTTPVTTAPSSPSPAAPNVTVSPGPRGERERGSGHGHDKSKGPGKDG